MAYDEDLSDRVRALLGAESRVSEQRMFGGLAFLIGGNMAVAIGSDDMLVRMSPADAEELVAAGEGVAAVMGSRRMRGWVEVSTQQLEAESALAAWVHRGVEYARSLPPKERRR